MLIFNSKNRSNSWNNKSDSLKKPLKTLKLKRKQHTRVVLSRLRSILNKMLKLSRAIQRNWISLETFNIKLTKNTTKKRLKWRKLSEMNLLKNWTNQNWRALHNLTLSLMDKEGTLKMNASKDTLKKRIKPMQLTSKEDFRGKTTGKTLTPFSTRGRQPVMLKPVET